MSKTVILDLLTNFWLGQLFALAGIRILKKTDQPMKSYPFVLVVLYELFVFLPAGFYLYINYPDWSLMYLVPSYAIPAGAVPFLLLGYPIMIVLGFYIGSRLIRLEFIKQLIILFAATLVALAAIAGVFAKRLMVVGNYNAFINGDAALLWKTHLLLGLIVMFAIAIPSAGYVFFLIRKEAR